MKQLFEYFLNEMSYDRKDFRQIIFNLDEQIVINWCLTKYATLTNNLNRNHWASELESYIKKIARIKVKKDNQHCKIKKQVLTTAFIYQNEFNDSSIVRMVVGSKFKKEGIDPMNNPAADKAIKMFANELEYLIEIMASNSEQIIERYCKTL